MRTFRSLRHRNYRLYFIGQMVSLIGSWTQITALMWLAHTKSEESSRWPAFLAAAQLGPTFLFGAWGGRLADRIPKRPLIISTQCVFFVCAIALLMLHSSGKLTLWAMLVVMLMHGAAQAIDLPARLSFLPNLVARTDLSNAVALNSLLFNVARATGPALAAMLLSSLGASWCFLLNALSYVAVIAALAWIYVPLPEGKGVPTIGGAWRALGSVPGLLTLALLAGVVAGHAWPLLALLPSFAAKELALAEGGYGTLLSSVGIGALAAALTAATAGSDIRPKVLLVGGLLAVCGALAGLWFATTLPVSACCCVLFGFGMILFFATGQSVVQLSTKDADRGKVMGVWAMMLSAGVPLGNLVLGPAADLYGVKTIILVQAIAITLATVALMFRRVG